MFVYPSLSQSLFPGLLIAISALMAFCKSIIRTSPIELPASFGLVIIWMVYILLHHAFIPAETYRMYYYLTGMLLCLSTTILLRTSMLKWHYIENIFLYIGCLQAVVVIFQLLFSNDSLVPVTGCGNNPSTAAIFLTCCTAVTLQRIKEHRFLFFIVALLFITCIVFLKCRTAYAGLSLAAVMLLRRTNMIKQRWRFVSITSAIMVLVFILWAYNFKKSSSDGRILIWKISSMMIIEKPQGYGYGLFEKHYNLAQARYFSSCGSDKEKMLADHIYMAYNDLLEQTVEGGIVGGLLFLMLFFHMIFFSCKNS